MTYFKACSKIAFEFSMAAARSLLESGSGGNSSVWFDLITSAKIVFRKES